MFNPFLELSGMKPGDVAKQLGVFRFSLKSWTAFSHASTVNWPEKIYPGETQTNTNTEYDAYAHPTDESFTLRANELIQYLNDRGCNLSFLRKEIQRANDTQWNTQTQSDYSLRKWQPSFFASGPAGPSGCFRRLVRLLQTISSIIKRHVL